VSSLLDKNVGFALEIYKQFTIISLFPVFPRQTAVLCRQRDRDFEHAESPDVRAVLQLDNRTTKTNGVSYIVQKGGAAVFTPEGQAQIRANIRIYKQNARILMQALDELGMWYTGGKNAPYIWLKCPDGMDSWSFFDFLLNEIQVIGTPGEGFGACGDGYFRLSSFGSTEDTKAAAERMIILLRKKNI
jgi:aspartate/methionine/tyrosine aminotransferase